MKSVLNTHNFSVVCQAMTMFDILILNTCIFYEKVKGEKHPVFVSQTGFTFTKNYSLNQNNVSLNENDISLNGKLFIQSHLIILVNNLNFNL